MIYTVKGSVTLATSGIVMVLFTVFFLPLRAWDADLGVGIGLAHASYRTEGEFPDFASKVSYFRDFPTVFLEAGVPVSEILKLNLRIYPHSRNYSLVDYDDDGPQLMEYYLDMPLSLRARIGSLEVGAGAGVGYKFTHIGISEIHSIDDIEECEDHLPTFMPSFNVGARVPLGKGEPTSLNLDYYQDLGPFSEAWGTKVYHKRFLATLSYRFKNMSPRQDLLPTQKIAASLGDTNLAIGAGFHLASMKVERVPEETFESINHKRGIWLPALEIGRKVHPWLELQTGISTNKRQFSIREYDDYEDRFSLEANYVDIPLIMRVKLYGVEMGAGPTLSVLTAAKYKRRGDLEPEHAPYEAARLIPGASLGFRYAKGRMGLNLYYCKDLTPFSENYHIDKYQDRYLCYLSYRLGQAEPLNDLLPRELARMQPSESHLFGGLKKSIWGGSAKISVVMGLDKVSRFPTGFGFGYRLSAAALRSKFDEGEALSMLDLAAQARFSYKKGIGELWLGPGFGMGSGLAVTDAEYFPIFPFLVPKACVEAGVRVHVLRQVAVDLSWEQSSILFLMSGFGLGSTTTSSFGVPYLGLALGF